MGKSILYAVNLTAQNVADGNTINFGSLVRKYGCDCNISGGNAVVRSSGFYVVDTNIDFTASAAGTVTIALYQDGVAIPGAYSTRTVVADTQYQITIPAVIRTRCCRCNDSTITAVVTGQAINVTNAAIIVERSAV